MTEYSGGGGGGPGIWSVRSMALVSQMAALLNQTEDVGHSVSIEEPVGTIPWLNEGASAARKRWAEGALTQEVKKRACTPTGQEARRHSFQKSVAAAAADLKKGAADKEAEKAAKA